MTREQDITTDCPRLARIYLAEFMRLYEHYRARVQFARRQAGEDTFKLAVDSSWTKKYFTAGSPETKARTAMAGSDGSEALEPAA
jgi:hypothetical protein